MVVPPQLGIKSVVKLNSWEAFFFFRDRCGFDVINDDFIPFGVSFRQFCRSDSSSHPNDNPFEIEGLKKVIFSPYLAQS